MPATLQGLTKLEHEYITRYLFAAIWKEFPAGETIATDDVAVNILKGIDKFFIKYGVKEDTEEDLRERVFAYQNRPTFYKNMVSFIKNCWRKVFRVDASTTAPKGSNEK